MTKARKTDTTDRTTPYRDWHRTWASTDYVHDIDQLEWRIVNGKRVYIALIELTALMPHHKMPYALDAIMKRINKVQGKVMVDVANALDVPALVVAFTPDLGNFYVYSLTSGSKWHQADRDTYRGWIDALVQRKVAFKAKERKIM
jgi:thiaminase